MMIKCHIALILFEWYKPSEIADLAQLGERQTEDISADLEVLCSIHRIRIFFLCFLFAHSLFRMFLFFFFFRSAIRL